MSRYRVREARVRVCNGYRGWFERRFIAERRVVLCFGISWWWPVTDGEWRASAEQARRDAEWDAHLRAPLADPEFFEAK